MGCSAVALRLPLLGGWIIAAAAVWSNCKTSSDFIGDSVLQNERLTIEIRAEEIMKELTLNLSVMQRYTYSSLCSTLVTGESPTALSDSTVLMRPHEVHSQLIMPLSRNGTTKRPYASSFSCKNVVIACGWASTEPGRWAKQGHVRKTQYSITNLHKKKVFLAMFLLSPKWFSV